MSDTAIENPGNSKTNLIEMTHVGVTAKMQTPLNNLIQLTSSSETDHFQHLANERNPMKYSQFRNEQRNESESSSVPSKILYEMRTRTTRCDTKKRSYKCTPSRIEFQLYRKERIRRPKRSEKLSSKMHQTRPNVFDFNSIGDGRGNLPPSFCERLRQSFNYMCKSNMEMHSEKMFSERGGSGEPAKSSTTPQETFIGIYPFDHGCAEYLRATDSHPPLLSFALAERATYYATRFWAEFFGSLHIAVTFVVTFILQTYRFILYSLVNTLLVGLLRMTSDYTIKPLLAVIFNGLLQPPLIFLYNILSSVRDTLEPIADTFNNFVKPLATVVKGVRLVHVSYNYRKLTKEV